MNVCADCFEDEDLRGFVEGQAAAQVCDFCGARSSELIAALLDDVAAHILHYLRMDYIDPADALLWAEGQYWGLTWGTEELLYEIGLELPRDKDGRLLEALAHAIDKLPGSPEFWTERNPYGLREQEQLQISWQSFAEFVMHQRRFFFRKVDLPREEYEDLDRLGPDELLESIAKRARDVGVIGRLRAGTKIYRARYQKAGDTHDTAGALGPPPVGSAKQNRMSPAGVPMFHGAEDTETALVEVYEDPGDYAVGEFVTTRDAWILDLHDVPNVPGYFSETQGWQRRALIFLHTFAEEVSKPIERDGREHIEYVPTQVLTEYFKTQATFEGERIEGISFTSSRTGRRNYTLFMTRGQMESSDAAGGVGPLLRFEQVTVVRREA